MSAIHFDRGGKPRCGTPWSTALTGDPAAVTCLKCAGIHAGTWATGWSRTGRVWADHKPHGTPAAARRHYRRGEPLCASCDQRVKRDRREHYWAGKAAAA